MAPFRPFRHNKALTERVAPFLQNLLSLVIPFFFFRESLRSNNVKRHLVEGSTSYKPSRLRRANIQMRENYNGTVIFEFR